MADSRSGNAQAAADKTLLKDLASRLTGGLQPEVEPRAYSHEEVIDVVGRLKALRTDDYDAKLVIGGFTLQPYGEGDDEQACETCMYYQVHRKFCELPELMLPVSPKWSCRLWRI
ncbi:MAG: hypothetical protein AAGH76_18210 [Pseudomonadota bacterium]